jgi:hypothetical protein
MFGVRGAGLQIADEVLRPVEDTYDFRPRIAYRTSTQTM